MVVTALCESMVDGRVAMALAMAMGTSGGDWPDVLLGAVIDELAERVGAAPALASAAALRDLRGGDRRVELRRDLWVEVVGGELRVLHAVELPDFEERVLDVGGDEVDVEGLGRFSVSASIVDEIATEGNRQWIAAGGDRRCTAVATAAGGRVDAASRHDRDEACLRSPARGRVAGPSSLEDAGGGG